MALRSSGSPTPRLVCDVDFERLAEALLVSSFRACFFIMQLKAHRTKTAATSLPSPRVVLVSLSWWWLWLLWRSLKLSLSRPPRDAYHVRPCVARGPRCVRPLPWPDPLQTFCAAPRARGAASPGAPPVVRLPFRGLRWVGWGEENKNRFVFVNNFFFFFGCCQQRTGHVRPSRAAVDVLTLTTTPLRLNLAGIFLGSEQYTVFV